MANTNKEDPLDKIRNLIREEIGASEKARERKEIEAKDPWEKLRGIVREEMGTYFKDLGEGVDDGKAKEKKQKPDEGDDKILGGIFG